MRHTLIIKDPEFQYMDGVAHRTSQLAGAGAPVHPKTYCSPVYRPAILLQLMILLVLLRRNSGLANGISSSEWMRLPAASTIVAVTKTIIFFDISVLDWL
jgi:hypothetical protein